MSAIGMPGHLLALFAPRPALERLPAPKHKTYKPYTGLGDLTSLFETTAPPAVEAFEPPKERKERLKREKQSQVAAELRAKIAEYDPFNDPEKVKTADPRKTLFVGRLSYETTEKKLLKTFEAYGPVRDIRLVTDRENKPRGYAFIEFKSSDSLRSAYRDAMDKVIDGRKIVVDYERARTTKKWLPRRLGGGEGPPRKGVSKKELAARAAERRLQGGGGGPMRREMSGGGPPGGGGGRGGNNRRRDNFPPREGGGGRYRNFAGTGQGGGGGPPNNDHHHHHHHQQSRGGDGGGGNYRYRNYGPYSGGSPPPRRSYQRDSDNATGANNIPVGRRY